MDLLFAVVAAALLGGTALLVYLCVRLRQASRERP